MTLASYNKDKDYSWLTYIIFLYIYAALAVIVLLLVTLWTFKFVRVFQCTKKLTLMFLVLVCISSLAKLLQFVGEILYYSYNWNNAYNYWTEAALQLLAPTLFVAAIVVNSFNWVYQTLKVDQVKNNIRRKQFPYHIAFGFLETIVIAQYIAIVALTCRNPFASNKYNIFGIGYGAAFLLVAAVYTSVGINFYRMIRKISKCGYGEEDQDESIP